MGSCEAFYPAFVKFGTDLYNCLAAECLQAGYDRERYLEMLNFDLKTLVCDLIAPPCQKPITGLKDAIEADRHRRDLPEWTNHMAYTWGLIDHPEHHRLHFRITVDFVKVLEDDTNLKRSALIQQLHNALSRRTMHWLASWHEPVGADTPLTLPTEGDSKTPRQSENPGGPGAITGQSIQTRASGNATKGRLSPRDRSVMQMIGDDSFRSLKNSEIEARYRTRLKNDGLQGEALRSSLRRIRVFRQFPSSSDVKKKPAKP